VNTATNNEVNKRRSWAYLRNRMVDRARYTSKSREGRDFLNDQPTSIIPNFLYIAGHKALQNPDALARLGITHVLSTAKGLKINATVLRSLDIKLESLPVRDKPHYAIRAHFEHAFAFIEEAAARLASPEGGRVIVNCKRGVSRSATFVIAYLMWRYQLTLDQAFSIVAARRPRVRPNVGFMVQLRAYEGELNRSRLSENRPSMLNAQH
jgi:protein-tyrosine phosphatase